MAASKFARVKIGRYKTKMRLLALSETLRCGKEAARLFGELRPVLPAMDEATLRAMAENAALAGLCLYRGRRPAFGDAKSAAGALTPGELALVAAAYRKLRQRLLGRRERDGYAPVPPGKVKKG